MPLDLYTADEVASIHMSKKQIDWKIKYGNYDEAMECIQQSFFGSRICGFNGRNILHTRKLFEVWNDESQPFYRKITETVEKGSFAGEGIGRKQIRNEVERYQVSIARCHQKKFEPASGFLMLSLFLFFLCIFFEPTLYLTNIKNTYGNTLF